MEFLCLKETKSSFSELRWTVKPLWYHHDISTWRHDVSHFLNKFLKVTTFVMQLCVHVYVKIRAAGYYTSVSSFPYTQIAHANVKLCV